MNLLSAEVNTINHDRSRHGGYSPAQWVLGRAPNRPGDRFDEDTFADMGTLPEKLDAGSAFAFRQDIGTAARKAFVRVDCGGNGLHERH